MNSNHSRLAMAARLLFWAALVVAFVMAILPAPPQVMADDKSQHMLAFGVLTLLMGLAWPRLTIRRIALVMGAFGALIEVVQLIPKLHRDADIADWRADMIAVVAMLVVIALIRGGLRGRGPAPAE